MAIEPGSHRVPSMFYDARVHHGRPHCPLDVIRDFLTLQGIVIKRLLRFSGGLGGYFINF